MKKALITILPMLLLNTTILFEAHATFPGETIVFGNREQSNEQKDKALMKAYDLATQKKYKEALEIVDQKIITSPKLALNDAIS